jgi:type IV secretion system protein VirD4
MTQPNEIYGGKNSGPQAARAFAWAVTALDPGPTRSGVRMLRKLGPAAILAFGVGAVNAFIPSAWTAASTIAKIELLMVLAFLGIQVLVLTRKTKVSSPPACVGGCARFATYKESSLLTQSQSGLLIGRDGDTAKFLRYDGTAHLLTLSSTKNDAHTATIVPNLLTAARPVLCIDPDGAASLIASEARRRFGSVHILDPFGITGLPSAAFNPLQALNPERVEFADNVNSLVDALFIDDLDVTGPAHWNRPAKQLIVDLIHMIVAVEAPERRHLGTLHDYLRRPLERFQTLLREIRQIDNVDGKIVRIADRYLECGQLEALSVLHRARRQIEFLGNSGIGAVLRHSTFSFADLNNEAATVFLVLPSDRLSTYSRWLRLIISQSLTELVRSERKSPTPVLYLLNEFASLGQLASLKRAMGVRAGSGVQLWPILQDVRQLHAVCGRLAHTLLRNADILQIIGVNDQETARLLSDLLGQETVDSETGSSSTASQRLVEAPAWKGVARPLMTPEEIFDLPQEVGLLVRAGGWPIIAARLSSDRDREFRSVANGLTPPTVSPSSIAATRQRPPRASNSTDRALALVAN